MLSKWVVRIVRPSTEEDTLDNSLQCQDGAASHPFVTTRVDRRFTTPAVATPSGVAGSVCRPQGFLLAMRSATLKCRLGDRHRDKPQSSVGSNTALTSPALAQAHVVGRRLRARGEGSSYDRVAAPAGRSRGVRNPPLNIRLAMDEDRFDARA